MEIPSVSPDKRIWYNFIMLIFDTICALATPPYKSALALIRLSGPKCLNVISGMLKMNVKTLIPNHTFFSHIYRDKKDPSSLIDEAMLTYYQAPKSYTGFDTVEFSVHGNMIIVEELLNALVDHGARRAKPGEFSAQAYYNGKMDLLKSEGINDLINANSKRAKDIASKTLSGKNSETMNKLKTTLLDDISELEYFVEDQYTDEKDDYDEELNHVRKSLSDELNLLSRTIEKTKRCNREYQGINVCIAGEPNVGKSSLLNAILNEDKAIVSPIAGTTRDVVEGEKEIDGILFRFKDTAGIHKSDDLVENLGIEKSYRMVKEADLVLLASDSGFEDIEKDEEFIKLIQDKPCIRIATKKDINRNLKGADIAICSHSDDLSRLYRLMEERLDIDKKEDSAFLGQREEDFLVQIASEIEEAIHAIDDTHQIDIVSDDIRKAVATINDMMGKQVTQTMEDIYATLFSKFCLGK